MAHPHSVRISDNKHIMKTRIKEESLCVSYTQRYVWNTQTLDSRSKKPVFLTVYWTETFVKEEEKPISIYTRHLEDIQVVRSVEGITLTQIDKERIITEFRDYLKQEDLLNGPNISSVQY